MSPKSHVFSQKVKYGTIKKFPLSLIITTVTNVYKIKRNISISHSFNIRWHNMNVLIPKWKNQDSKNSHKSCSFVASIQDS